MKLAATRIFVRDLEAAAAFYEHRLGLNVRARGLEHGYVVCEAQNCDVVLERVPGDAPEEEQVLVGRFTGLSFAVDDIAGLYRTLSGQGVPFGGPPERQLWGGTLATLADPAGNQLQLVEYPRTA